MTMSTTLRSVLRVLLLAAFAGGCGSDGTNSSNATCSNGGKAYQVGESFPSQDGCNTCYCGSNGLIACTLVACLNDASPRIADGSALADLNPDGSTQQSCTYNGKTYPFNVTFMATDGCNECWCAGNPPSAMCTLVRCSEDAAVLGLEVSVGTCSYGGKQYPSGASFPATDGCNTCDCGRYLLVACTMTACLGDGGSMTGDALPSGDLGADSCVYNGKTYPSDVMFSSADGCNSCHCVSNGQVACTFSPCPSLDAGVLPIDAPAYPDL